MAISGKTSVYSGFELMTSFPFPDENSVVIANLRDLTSALAGAGQSQGLTSNNVPVLHGAQFQT